MTALCGGGTSGVKSGVGASVIFDAGLITAGLGIIDPLLLPFAALVDAFVYDALSACATDPPAMPSSADLNVANAIGGVLNPNFGTWLSAVHDLILNYAWSQFCECTSPPQPTFVYPQPPAGQTQPITPVVGPCFAGFWTGTPWDATSNPPLVNNLDTAEPPGTVSSCGGTGVPCTALSGTIPTGVSATLQVSGATGTGDVEVFLAFYNSTGTFLTSHSAFATVSGGTGEVTSALFTVPSTTARVYVSVFVGPGNTYFTCDATLTLSWYCNNTTPTNSGGACCVDPTTLNVLNEIYSLIKLMQRQIVPFGTVQGAAHSGLTGQGSFSVPRLIGVQIALTTIPASYGLEVGSPDVHFDLGWLSASTPDGFIDETRVTRATQAWYPRIMSDVNLIGYSLSPGVVATITEVEAEV